MEERELAEALVERLRPHLTEEDMYYVEGVQIDHDWALLIKMMRSFADRHAIYLPRALAA